MNPLVSLAGMAMWLLAACGAAAAAPASPEFPITVAGLRLEALVRSINEGDARSLERLAAESFAQAEQDPAFAAGQADQLHRLFELTGGLSLRRIEASDTATLQVLAQAKATAAWYRLSLFATAAPPEFTRAAPPYKIVGFGVDAVTAPPALADSAVDDKQLRERLDRLLAQLVRRGGFAGVVQVQRGERTLYARAFGEADREARVPNGLNTRFNLASITKMFTAVAIGQLVEAGKLQLTDPVGRWLPELAGSELGQRVTVHHLLSHTSGVVGAREAIEKGLEPPSEATTLAQMAAPFVGAPLSFHPGQQFDYSNAGYVLLGAIIERAAGETYHAYVQRHVFDAAGMRETGFFMRPGRHPGRMAVGYKDGPGHQRVPNTADLPLIGTPAHMAFSTAGDMARFAAALYRGQLLRAELLDRFWTGVTEQPDGVEYGYGARIEQQDGRRIVWHGGGAPGATNRFEMVPAEGLTIVVLSNVDSEPAIIANKLREWLSPKDAAVLPASSKPPDLVLSMTQVEATTSARTGTTLEVQVSNRGGTAHAALVDVEIKDQAGRKVEQQIVADQRLGAGQTRIFRFEWTPDSPGRYRVDAGIFGPGWSKKLLFVEGLATIEVR
ncbi:serine hydrolase [Ideonella sp. YS5]|uniref:serine hydrolase n=1 Tax=Ideonella sp. YS5 TaxID=3453714 RepID=UPI003EE8DD94